MESLFFNTPNQRYQTTKLFQNSHEHLTKVDVSNGIFFYDISLNILQNLSETMALASSNGGAKAPLPSFARTLLKNRTKTIKLKNLDRMVMIAVVKSGSLVIENHIDNKTHNIKENSIIIYCSSRQDFSLSVRGEIFVLFIADFFLKRYLSFDANEPIDFLYEKIQYETVLEQINHQPTDALSLYLIEKIIHTKKDENMKSMRCMNQIMEFITHRLSLLDMVDEKIEDELVEIASEAKRELLRSFTNPPTIEALAHICATNESKLKKAFKKVYKSTIYSYVQKLRLEEANLLLREECMTIGEIAKRVGYKHQGHFSKLFFETYGVYPKDLLKR